MTSTEFVTVSGKVVDMFAPVAEKIDFDDIAEHLAKEARYNGGTPGKFYSVAQHLVLAADWALAEACLAAGFPGRHAEIGNDDFPHGAALGEAGDRKIDAAYVLAHDFHEYVLKDETTPKKRALDRVAHETLKLDPCVISDCDARLTERWDAAIHKAAGLPWPIESDATRELVDTIDKRILLTEWAALHRGHKLLGNYDSYEPLPIKIEPWGWEFCQWQISNRMGLLLPALRKALA